MRLAGLVQSILLGHHANAQKAMLLDTTVQTSDLVRDGPTGWTKPSGSQWMDSNTIINQDGDTLRTWSICKKPTPNGNWIISPYIGVNSANAAEAELTYWIRDCKSLGRVNGQCAEEIEVYAQVVDAYEQRDFDTYSTAWEKIGTISAADALDSDQMGRKKFNLPSNKSGLFLGFKDYGSCTSINSVRVYTSSCVEETRQLATFGESGIGSQATGKCVENAIQDSYFTEPKMECTESGWREIDYKGCVCDAGYEPDEYNQKCIACQPGTYKRLSGNEKCEICPSNSNSGPGQIKCECSPGHYRAMKNRPDDECIGIPGAPSDIEYSTTDTSAQIYWKRPTNYPRRDIFYRIECEQCMDDDDNMCQPCDQQIVFSHGPDDIFEGHKGTNQLEINNLEPSTLYKLKLLTLNRISDLAAEDGKLAKYQRIILRTDPSIHQETPEVVGSVKVDLRNDEARVTWGSVETDKYEMTIIADGEQDRNVFTVSDEHTLTDLAPDQTYTIKVRAVLNGIHGPWSIEEVFKTAPLQNGPSVEPIVENEGTNWIAVIVFAVVMIIALFGTLIFFVVRNVGRKWSKQSNGAYGQSMDGTMDAHFDLIPQIVRKSPTQIDGLSISSDHESLPAHADMTRGYYHERPVLLQYGYLTEDQFQVVHQLDHQNVLKCLGFAPSRQQLVFEYAEHGTLPALMGYHRLDIVTVTRILRDIASAINFLHSNSYIHRQLTTYNVFVSGASYTPKVAKYLTSSDLRPDLRRSAPEVWDNQPFTIFSDVWSFGTIMWEVLSAYSGGETEPYRGFEESEIVEQMRQGRHLPRPAECPDAIYALITACWASRPAQRPTMAQLYLELNNILNQMDTGAVAV